VKLSEERIVKKFDDLLQESKKILGACGWDGKRYSSHPSDIDYQRWRSQSLNLIEQVCGKKSAHFDAMQKIAELEISRHNSYYYKDCVGILEAAYCDYNDGMLAEIRNLIRADLIDDLLSQAEMLLENGYHVAAASLSGAVLEDTLRKICDSNSIEYPVNTKINVLNSALSTAEIYDKLTNKEIIAKADIRNNADHGHFDKVREEDVRDMIRWIRRFVSDYLN